MHFLFPGHFVCLFVCLCLICCVRVKSNRLVLQLKENVLSVSLNKTFPFLHTNITEIVYIWVSFDILIGKFFTIN